MDVGEQGIAKDTLLLQLTQHDLIREIFGGVDTCTDSKADVIYALNLSLKAKESTKKAMDKIQALIVFGML